MNVGNWLFKRSLISPEKTAIVFEDRRLTYRAMNQRVNRLSQALLSADLRLGDRVGVLSRNCPEFLEVYFACAKTGLIFVPLNFRLAPPELAYQIQDSGLKVLFYDQVMGSLVRKSREGFEGHFPAQVFWGKTLKKRGLFMNNL